MEAAVGRLKRRSDFLRIAALRRKWATPGVIVQVAPMTPAVSAPEAAPDQRIGFTCSKKVGNAVQRNRARRRLRAAAAAILPRHAARGLDFVLIGRPDTIHRPFDLLLRDLRTALKRLDAVRPDAEDNSPDATRGKS